MSANLTKVIFISLIFFLLISFSACDNQSVGFALPPGDADAGRTTFLQLECNHCHSVKNDVAKQKNGHADISFELGGITPKVKTYGNLVTSIINPSHKIAANNSPDYTNEAGYSKMRVYNEVMTIQQLIDLTAYLQNSYELVVPRYTPYYGP